MKRVFVCLMVFAALALPAYSQVPSRYTGALTTERARYLGTYHTRIVNPSPQDGVYERTYRVFEHIGQLIAMPVSR